MWRRFTEHDAADHFEEAVAEQQVLAHRDCVAEQPVKR